MTLSIAVYSFVVIMIAYIVKGLVGFGDPLLSNPLLAMRLDNKDITPALLPVSLILNAVIVWKNRHRWRCARSRRSHSGSCWVRSRARCCSR